MLPSGNESETAMGTLAGLLLRHPGFRPFWRGYTQGVAFTSNVDSEDGGEPLYGGSGQFNDSHPDSWDEWGPMLTEDERVMLVREAWEFYLKYRMYFRHHDSEQAGTDFHLDRNGHGSGFQDREYYDEAVAKILTEGAREYGGAELYGTLDEDGEIESAYIIEG